MWPDGFFGENLTLDELDEDDLRIGEILAFGDEVRLAVAGPRNPCAKLSWRLGQPLNFQKIFQRSHRTGVYFSVVRPGTVRPGDTVRRVAGQSTMPSVATVAEFAAGHAIPPAEPLTRVLACPGLSPTIRHILSAKREAAERAAARSEGRWQGWPLHGRRAVEEARLRSFHLRPQDHAGLCTPRPGSFVSVQLKGPANKTITRCWSLSSYDHRMDQYRITVRRQRGPGSTRLHELRVGDRVGLRAPAGDFVLDMGGYRPVVLIAACIGITPLLAMLHAHLTREATGVPVYLIYGARTPSDVTFREELAALATAHTSLRMTYVYSRSAAGGRPASRITLPLILEQLADLHVFLGERRIALPWYESDMYLCGPGDFCQRLKTELVDRGANPDHIFSESFSALQTVTTDLESAEIEFSRSGARCTWHADEDLTLLELAERSGVAVKSDCRAGSCLTCKTRVLEGAVTADLGDGTGLLCIGRPNSVIVKLDC
jgi:ferredoxin-NADP reductase